MLSSNTKKNKVIRKWHSKAMLIDPKRTKITIINAAASNLNDSAESIQTVDDLKCNLAILEAPVIIDYAESIEYGPFGLWVTKTRIPLLNTVKLISDCAEDMEVVDETLSTPVSFVLVNA